MARSQKVVPFLWFDKEAGAAARFYASVFPDAKIKNVNTLENTPSGAVDVVTAGLPGLDIRMMSAGPAFKITPALSFLVRCTSASEVEVLWRKLSPGGSEMIELGSYLFSERYGWVQDKYGVSWQVGVFTKGAIRQKIVPSMMFVGKACGKAEEAIKFYTSVFRDSQLGEVERYGGSEAPDTKGTVKFGAFKLEGQWFAAMDSAHKHAFAFNEATSFEVNCDNQEEIDYYWDKLSADPAAEVCGWLKDKYGFSWQIVPKALEEMLRDKDRRRVARVTESFLKMKKMILSDLQRAYAGR